MTPSGRHGIKDLVAIADHSKIAYEEVLHAAFALESVGLLKAID